MSEKTSTHVWSHLTPISHPPLHEGGGRCPHQQVVSVVIWLISREVVKFLSLCSLPRNMSFHDAFTVAREQRQGLLLRHKRRCLFAECWGNALAPVSAGCGEDDAEVVDGLDFGVNNKPHDARTCGARVTMVSHSSRRKWKRDFVQLSGRVEEDSARPRRGGGARPPPRAEQVSSSRFSFPPAGPPAVWEPRRKVDERTTPVEEVEDKIFSKKKIRSALLNNYHVDIVDNPPRSGQLRSSGLHLREDRGDPQSDLEEVSDGGGDSEDEHHIVDPLGANPWVKEFFDFLRAGGGGTGVKGVVGSYVREDQVHLFRDAQSRSSRGRCVVRCSHHLLAVLIMHLAEKGMLQLKSNKLRVQWGGCNGVTNTIFRSWEAPYDLLVKLAGMHDGIRSLVGEVYMQPVGQADHGREVGQKFFDGGYLWRSDVGVIRSLVDQSQLYPTHLAYSVGFAAAMGRFGDYYVVKKGEKPIQFPILRESKELEHDFGAGRGLSLSTFSRKHILRSFSKGSSHSRRLDCLAEEFEIRLRADEVHQVLDEDHGHLYLDEQNRFVLDTGSRSRKSAQELLYLQLADRNRDEAVFSKLPFPETKQPLVDRLRTAQVAFSKFHLLQTRLLDASRPLTLRDAADVLRISHAADLLRVSDTLEPGLRKLSTNMIVDLMLDLRFKREFGGLFTLLYKRLVFARTT